MKLLKKQKESNIICMSNAMRHEVNCIKHFIDRVNPGSLRNEIPSLANSLKRLETFINAILVDLQ